MTTKDYALSLEAKTSYLFAQASGPRSRESVIEITSEVFNAALVNRLAKVLVDVRTLEGRLGVLDIYFVVTELFQKLRGKGVMKAAIVDRPQSTIREWFLENVAVNRGFNLRIFSEVEEALQWLLATTDL